MDKPSISDLISALTPLNGDEAFSVLARHTAALNWSEAPGQPVPLAGGATLSFDRRRRSATIRHAGGGTSVFDLGRPDRLRPVGAVLPSGLSVQAGPAMTLTALHTPQRGAVVLREPVDSKGPFGLDSLPVGVHGSSRHLDSAGRPVLIALGRLDSIRGFGTFTTSDGSGYAHLRTRTGLGCLYDQRRKSFGRLVTDEVTQRARAEGIASVDLNGVTIGVVFDCGSPGDYLALSAYDADTGGVVATVVDLRRPPVKDGAILDP